MQNDDLMDIKSEIVDDVLEILIKNGELPASAAAEPLSLDDLDPDLMEVDTDWLDSLALSPPPSSAHRGEPLIGEFYIELYISYSLALICLLNNYRMY